MNREGDNGSISAECMFRDIIYDAFYENFPNFRWYEHLWRVVELLSAQHDGNWFETRKVRSLNLALSK